jgi:hypothetical protein
VSDDSEERVRAILKEASALLGEGGVRLEVVSAPVIEWVYVGLEDNRVVVSDKGATFGWIAGVHGVKDEFVNWSPERARVPADTFGVSLIDETERDHEGEVVAMGWRLARAVSPGESVAEVVQAVAHAIDGVFAVHVREGAHSGYFWDTGPRELDYE